MAKKKARKKDVAIAPSRLQEELAGRILKQLKELGAGPGYHLVELDLCQKFGVSRTPVRGALKILASRGIVAPRVNRGYVLIKPVTKFPVIEVAAQQNEEEKKLFIAIAQARNTGRLADECAQQELVRIFNAKLPVVIKVMRHLAELGVAERKPGNGWSFGALIDSARAQNESYAFRRSLEPASFLQPTFKLDPEWAKTSRERHMAFRRKPWRDTDAVDFYEVNADFHEQLARCSGNRYILSAVQRQIQLRRFLNYHWDYGVERVRDSIDEHLEILSALEAGWNDKAAALMLHHLTTSSAFTQPFDTSSNVAA